MKQSVKHRLIQVVLLSAICLLAMFMPRRQTGPAPVQPEQVGDSDQTPALPAAEPQPEPQPQPFEEPVLPQLPHPPLPRHEPSALERCLTEFCQDRPGTWDLCVQALNGQEQAAACSPEAQQPMVSASIIKLFVMAAVHDALEQGRLEETVCQPLIYHMITVSDNTSTNELIRLLGGGDAACGMETVNEFCRTMGFADSRLNRLMLENNGLQNHTSARDCAALLRMIYEGTCISPRRSEQMLSVLKEQTVVNRIPAGLPEGTEAAHKTGDLIGLCCADVGIVFSPQEDYILCVIGNDIPDDYAAALAIAALSEAVYGCFNGA